MSANAADPFRICLGNLKEEIEQLKATIAATGSGEEP